MKKLMLIMLLMMTYIVCTAATKNNAVLDTVACHYECIDRIVSEQTKSGKTKYFAVYNDTKNDISELIPVPETVVIYIMTCKENKIKPNLAIKLRNGIIVGLIRYKTRYGTKRHSTGR